MRRVFRLGVVLLALSLVAAACGDDDDDGDDAATTTEATTTTTEATTTTTTIPTVDVTYRFDTPLDETLADQAASTMERRLLKFFDLEGQSGDGTEVTVTDDGTGLDITVPNAESPEQAQQLVDGLSFRGDLYFRPTITEYAPPGAAAAPAEGASAPVEATLASAQVGAQGETTTTTAPAQPAPTEPPAGLPEAPPLTPAGEDDPNGTSVLPWRAFDTVEKLRNPDSAEILSVWEVGPAALSGNVIENTDVTTFSGGPAVQVVLATGSDGLDAFNAMAQSCFNADTACPGGAYAVSLDSNLIVVSVPRGTDATFTPFTQDDVIIWSDAFTEEVVTTLAVAFEAGALPTTITFVS